MSTTDIRLLKPQLNDDEGFYQIGPAAKCSDSFVLSITIAYAANLTQVTYDHFYSICR